MAGLLAKHRWLPETLLVAAVAVCYANATGGDFLFDDKFNIVRNPKVSDWSAPALIARERPVALWTFWLNAQLGGLVPWHFKLVNILIHAANACLAYRLVRATLRTERFTPAIRDRATGMAFAAALLWAVHPLCTQAVTYIVQRMESLMTTFYLAALLVTLRAATAERASSRWAWGIGAVALAWLAIQTKPVAITLPLAAVWIDRAFAAASWRETARRGLLFAGLVAAVLTSVAYLGREVRQRTAEPTPAAASSAISTPESDDGDRLAIPLDRAAKDRRATWWEYLRTQPEVLLHYLRLAVWPYPQVVDHDWPIRQNAVIGITLGLLILGWVAAVLWLMRRAPGWAFWLGLPLLVLGPTSSVIPIRDVAFEHRMYLPLLGLCVVAVLFVDQMLRRRGGTTAAIPLLTVVVLGFAAVTINRNPVYDSSVALWADIAQKRPQNARAWYNLAEAFRRRRDPADAERVLAYYENAVKQERQPSRRAVMLNGLARARLFLGREDGAVAAATEARTLSDDYAVAPFVLGEVARRRGDLDEAAALLTRAAKIDPGIAAIFSSLGRVALAQGSASEAVAAFDRAVDIEPDNVALRNNRAVALRLAGRFDEAIVEFDEVVGRSPGDIDARLERGRTLLLAERPAEAAADFEAVVQTMPNRPVAWALLIEAERRRGRDAVAERYRADAERRGLTLPPTR